MSIYFLLNNVIDTATHYSTSPAAHADFPGTSMADRDRYTLWRNNASTTLASVVLALSGSTTALQGVGVRNLRRISGTLETVSFATATAAAGPFTTQKSWAITATPIRDFGAVLASGPTATHVMITLSTATGNFINAVGGAWATQAANIIEVQEVYSRAKIQRVRMRNISQLAGGETVVNDFDNSYRNFQLQFDAIPQATLDKLNRVAAYIGSFMYIDDADQAYECTLGNDGLQYDHIWNSPALYNATLDLRQLP